MLRIGQRVVQECARLLPVALHRALRHSPHRSDIREREAAEVFEIDDLSQPRLHRAEMFDGIAEPLQACGFDYLLGHLRRQCSDLEGAATLESPTIAGVIDDERAHRA